MLFIMCFQMNILKSKILVYLYLGPYKISLLIWFLNYLPPKSPPHDTFD